MESWRIEEVNFCIVDTETTGFHSYFGDRICEIGALVIKNSKEKNSFQSLINPQRNISPGAFSVHHITDEMVKDAPTFDKIVPRLLRLFEGAVLVFHNAPFDLNFLLPQLHSLGLPSLNNPVVDTLILARKHFNFPSNALGNIARALHFPVENEHRAMGDVRITKQIFVHFLDKLKLQHKINTLNDLLELQGGSVPSPQLQKIILPPLLDEAFTSKKPIKIKYISAFGTETIREITPIQVAWHNDYTYLVGFCKLRKEQRTFRLDRILAMSPLP